MKTYTILNKQFLLLWICFFFTLHLQAQDLNSLMNDAEKNESEEKELVTATFKGTRVINLHTIETQGPRVLEFRISHRFGDLGSGGINAFGLDGGASMRLALEYCVDGRFNFGLGRSNIDKTVDGYLKYRLLRQTTKNEMPLSLTLLAASYLNTSKDPNTAVTGYNKFVPASNRLSYCFQAIMARRINDYVSVQIAPTMLHFNLVPRKVDKNDMFALAFSGRVKINNRTAFTCEYTHRLTLDYANQKDAAGNQLYYNPFAFGVDIETGGHVFQIHFANSQGIIENQFIPFTTTSFKNWGIKLGFNISRVYSL
ncbi:MAG: hypothetical protein IT238_02580 [Bacteroidia bacterium]|nr:hypothetical protein [Bacteroidia bacterium]